MTNTPPNELFRKFKMTDEQYEELFDILTPRMQKQLIESLHDLEPVHNNPADEPEHGDFTIKGNTLFL